MRKHRAISSEGRAVPLDSRLRGADYIWDNVRQVEDLFMEATISRDRAEQMGISASASGGMMKFLTDKRLEEIKAALDDGCLPSVAEILTMVDEIQLERADAQEPPHENPHLVELLRILKKHNLQGV